MQSSFLLHRHCLNSCLAVSALLAAGGLGDAQVCWTEGAITTSADAPVSVFAADVDGDGDLDALSASQNDDKIAWYEHNLASATFRNAGSNPASYTATPPVLGAEFTGTVDLGGTSGHSLATLLGFATPLTFTLNGGQVLLVNFADPSGELLHQPVLPGPVAIFKALVPNDTSFCSFRLSTQALHIGGVQPFALSNAQDLVVGD